MTDKVALKILWIDNEPTLDAIVESAYPDHGFLIVELTEDMLKPGVKSKTLVIPMHRIFSVEIEELEELLSESSPGYRPETTFREVPGISPWFLREKVEDEE
jgi:hypothetical protein